jgi:hypothetical protein
MVKLRLFYKQIENKVDSKFVKLDEHLYEYNHINGQTSTINLSNRTCTCPETIEKGICLHLIRVACIEKFELPGMTSLDKFKKRQRKPKPGINEDISSSSLSEFEGILRF